MTARLTPRDTRAFWSASVIASDQFLLYCFDHADEPAPTAAAVAELAFARAPSIPELRMRVAPAPLNLERPSWAPCEVIEVRESIARTWDRIPGALARLFARQLDATVAPWRLHVFPGVHGAPRCTGPATVVVLQIAHCMADGQRSAEIARALFHAANHAAPQALSRVTPDAIRAVRGLAEFPVDLVRTIALGARVPAARARLARETDAGALPPAVPGCPLTVLNTRPDGTRDVRMMVRERAEVAAGTTVTVGALTAVSLAVERYLGLRGQPVPETLCAEVMVARPRRPGDRNAFGNVSVPLLPGLALAERPERIAAQLDAARCRAESPLWRAIGAPDDATPAVLAQLAVRSFDPAARPAVMAGATVVSSVYRGPPDLELFGGRSVFTAGFPALSPAMGVTHGVHGLGDTVTISVTSSRTAVPDPDAYSAVLAEALDQVAQSR